MIALFVILRPFWLLALCLISHCIFSYSHESWAKECLVLTTGVRALLLFFESIWSYRIRNGNVKITGSINEVSS